MSFLSNAVRLIRNKGMKDSQENLAATDSTENSVMSGESIELDFSFRNYAKESFSVLIVHPVSACMQKILRACSSVITGVLVGGLVALIACLIALQFGSVENTVISAFLLNKIENVLPDNDLIIKSAMLQWNSDEGAVEIDFKKVRFDNFVIPRISVLPDYSESFRQKRLVARVVSIVKPRIVLDVTNDFKTVLVNPNMVNGGSNKAYFESIKNIEAMKDFMLDNMTADGKVRLLNTDMTISENKIDWRLKNLFAEYDVKSDKLTKIVFSSKLPRQKYTSDIKVEQNADGSYDATLNSVNPSVIYNAFVKRNTPIEKVLPIIKGYNLPVSGNLNVVLNENEALKKCTFNLVAASGSIKLPNRNTLSLNLGKRIDNGTVTGTIQNNKLNINAMSLFYGNSEVQLTGITVPLKGFKMLDTANINGTLSLTNINLKEVYTMLPSDMSRSIIPIFKDYLPGFRLDSLKFDLKGDISFGNDTHMEKLAVSHGVFKIHDAKIPVDNKIMTNVDAVGTIKADGVDVKVSNAIFGDTKVNSGVFFISNDDNSWIGRANVDVPIKNVAKYANEFSDKVGSLPLDKLNLNGLAKLDLKIVRIAGQNNETRPFKLLEGDGVLVSSNNKNSVKISWNENKLSANVEVGDLKKNDSIALKVEEDFGNKSGYSEVTCNGESKFLSSLMPFMADNLSGNFKLKAQTSWDAVGEDMDVQINLKNANMVIPVIGHVKSQADDGKFSTHIHVYPDRIALSKINLDTPMTKLTGQLTADSDWNVTECVIDNIKMDGMSAQVSLLKKDENKTIVSLVGDSFDATKLLALYGKADAGVKFVTYLNLKNLSLFNGNSISNVKGTVEVLDGRVVKGACIGVIGDSTLALNTEDMKSGNDYLISISASNAGDFLKTVGISESISGGTINFVVKSSKVGSGALSGAFEMSNFLVKNNPQLTKLISLSSPNYLMGSDIVVGFNTCTGNISITDDQIRLKDCRAIGPTIAISMKGNYDRVNDDLNVKGLLLPMMSANNQGNSRLAANFGVVGSYWNPNLSVSTSKFISNDALFDTFGDSIPMLNSDGFIGREINDTIVPISSDIQDPYDQNAFDKVALEEPVRKVKKNQKAKKSDKRFGVTVRRGVKSIDMGE